MRDPAGGFGMNEGFVTEALYDLSRALGTRDPERQAHGVFGGMWGYGQDFENDVFEMWPYWWGDCDCGFAGLEAAWKAADPHTANCWLTRYEAEARRLRALRIRWPESSVRQEEWARANGWPDGRRGVGVYCNCGVDARRKEWRLTHGHDPRCSLARPNFKCGDVEVRWYKYIGRGMSCSREVTLAEWLAIFARCNASLAVTVDA